MSTEDLPKFVAREEMWCEQPGTRLLVEKTEDEFVDFTIKLGHISVTARIPQFRIERVIAVLEAKKGSSAPFP